MPAEAHTPMYNWHKFFARKTWNVVGQFVDNYCPKGGVVLDPFSGSGVTAIESVRRGRRAIAIDIIPVANNILRATVMPTNYGKLRESYLRIEKAIKNKIVAFYQTECRKCGKEIEFDCMIWQDNKPKRLRYKCPHCGDRREKGCTLLDSDKSLLDKINKTEIKLPYPKQSLYYTDGRPFKEKQKI